MHTRLVTGFIDEFSDGVSNFCKGERAFSESVDVDKKEQQSEKRTSAIICHSKSAKQL
jgi:hypothetical protein